jgi:spermidine synthase
MAAPSLSSTSESPRLLPLLVLLFAASGCSGLIYETVWYQHLQLAIGATAVSLGFLLATFMGGLCLGSLWLPRLPLAGRHPLRIYGAIELGIAASAILVHFCLPLVTRVYIAGAAHGVPGQLLRGMVCAVCLLPPTTLMGASLPAIVRWIRSSRENVSWWGVLYGGNTAGAVFGCLLSGFWLLRVYNMATATFVAAFLNLVVAAVSFRMAAVTAPGAVDPQHRTRPIDWPVYAAIAVSGATALGAEVLWTRLLGMLLGLTVYAFAIILAVFLTGLAIGSGIGSVALRAVSPRAALGWCQILLAPAIAWTAWIISSSLPYWPINPLLMINPWHIFQLDIVRCAWAILPPTLLWGASFPLAAAAVAAPGEDPGRVMGGIYAANTLGAIAGALGVSLILIPAAGTLATGRILLLTAVAGGLAVLLPILRSASKTAAALLTASVAIAVWLASAMPPIPGGMIAYGRRMAINAGQYQVLYTVEGRNSSVAITKWGDSTEIDVNGHVEATTQPYDMKLQRMVGHLPAMLHPNPKSVLGIGFGAGVSAGTFTRYPMIESITICEIEPVIPPTSTRFFGRQNYEVYRNPRTHVIFDDARHYLMTTTSKFDIIASDPLDVFAKGTASLYSLEYFEAVKRHLNPGGIFTLYVPLYESDEVTVRSELATFFEAFPNATIWANTVNGHGYDMVFMGHIDEPKIDVDQVQQRLDSPVYSSAAESLREIGVVSAVDLFSTYAGRKFDLGRWSAGAPINTDGDLRLQYLAGWGINSSIEDLLYGQILQHRRLPADIFAGSPEHLARLREALVSAVPF